MDRFANGSWLTRQRVVAIAMLTAIASALSLIWLFFFGRGTLDPLGRPLGTDFSMMWTAGRMALDGHAGDVWSLPKHFAVQQQFHHKTNVDVYGWHYPPPYLLIAAALAMLPYVTALVVWQATTLGAFALLMWRLVPRPETVLLTLAAPASLICITHGHNGFLTALLLGGGLALLEQRPAMAGLLFGCLIYKPQFALVVPPLLLVTRNWRAVAGALISSSVLVLLTLAMWGAPVWQAFADSLPQTRNIVIEQGSIGWYKIMSPFAAVRMWGGGLGLSYAVQAMVTTTSVVAVLFLSLRNNRNLRNAAVTAAVLLSTPYVLDYDFVVLGAGLAFLWRDGEENGFLPWDRTLMALVWIAPLVARQVAQFTYVPLGLASALLVLSIAVRRSEVWIKAAPAQIGRTL